MLIVNLVSWAGDNFSHAPGETINLADDLARARIDAGLAAPVETEAPPPDIPPKRGPGRPRKGGA